MAIEVTREVHQAMLCAAQQAHPNEACGILLGHQTLISQLLPAANVHPTPQTHFEIDPQALTEAHKAEREGGPQVMGYFHSHPAGDPCPSDTDQASSAGDGRIWAIVAGSDVKFWRDGADRFEPLSYEVSTR